MKLAMAGMALMVSTALCLPAAALDVSIGGKRDNNDSGVSVSVDRDGVKARAGNTRATVGTSSRDGGGIGVDAKVGGTRATASVGGSSGVDVDVNGDIDAKATILGPKGVLNGTARSDLLGGINAKLEVLSKKILESLPGCGGRGCLQQRKEPLTAAQSD